jgi:gamma-glutamyltranspeptidase/glutathione hydrolase
VRDVRAKGGCLSEADLTGYRAEWREPLDIAYRGGHLYAAPGPHGRADHGAGAACAAGRAAAGRREPAPTGAAYAAMARALDAAFRSRLSDMGDHEPPNVAQAPPCTTHFSVVDRDGNLCAVTQTLLSIFGSRVVSPATGVLLNNGIMWFDPEPGKPNSLGPGKRCLDQLLPRGGGGRGRPALRPGRLGRAQDPGRG